MNNEKLLEILKSNSDESYTSFSTMLSNTYLKIINRGCLIFLKITCNLIKRNWFPII